MGIARQADVSADSSQAVFRTGRWHRNSRRRLRAATDARRTPAPSGPTRRPDVSVMPGFGQKSRQNSHLFCNCNLGEENLPNECSHLFCICNLGESFINRPRAWCVNPVAIPRPFALEFPSFSTHTTFPHPILLPPLSPHPLPAHSSPFTLHSSPLTNC